MIMRHFSSTAWLLIWQAGVAVIVGTLRFPKNCGSHIDASLSRQPLVKGERLVRYEVNAVMLRIEDACSLQMFLSTRYDYCLAQDESSMN